MGAAPKNVLLPAFSDARVRLSHVEGVSLGGGLADRAGVPLALAWVTAPEELALQRLRSSSPDPRRASDATIQVYRELEVAVRLPQRPYMLVDTSGPIDPFVDRIVEILSEPRGPPAPGTK